jgi:hypothetical protein
MSGDSGARIGPAAMLACTVPGNRRSSGGALTRRRVDVDQVYSELPLPGRTAPAGRRRRGRAHDERHLSAKPPRLSERWMAQLATESSEEVPEVMTRDQDSNPHGGKETHLPAGRRRSP